MARVEVYGSEGRVEVDVIVEHDVLLTSHGGTPHTVADGLHLLGAQGDGGLGLGIQLVEVERGCQGTVPACRKAVSHEGRRAETLQVGLADGDGVGDGIALLEV